MDLWMRGRGVLSVVVAAILCCTGLDGTAVAQSRGANPTAVALADFTSRLNAYLTLQKKLAEKVGPLDESKTPEQIAARERALGGGVRTARSGAKLGDIFTPAAAALFTTVIRDEFRQRSRAAIQDRNEAQDELPDFTPSVNQIYPTTYPLATFPPGILRRIPPLPEPLEYRFVQRHLILRDSEANLIVDILPNAAPPMTSSSPPKPAPPTAPKPASR